MSQSRTAKHNHQRKDEEQQLNLFVSAPKRRKVGPADARVQEAPIPAPQDLIHDLNIGDAGNEELPVAQAAPEAMEQEFVFVADEPFDFLNEDMNDSNIVPVDKYGNPILDKEASSTALLALRSVFHFLNFKKKQADVTISLINAIQKLQNKQPIVSSQYMLDKVRRWFFFFFFFFFFF